MKHDETPEKKNTQIIFSLLGALGTIIININRVIKLIIIINRTRLHAGHGYSQQMRSMFLYGHRLAPLMLCASASVCYCSRKLCNFNQYISHFITHLMVASVRLNSSHSERTHAPMHGAKSPIICFKWHVSNGRHQTNVENVWVWERKRRMIGEAHRAYKYICFLTVQM